MSDTNEKLALLEKAKKEEQKAIQERQKLEKEIKEQQLLEKQQLLQNKMDMMLQNKEMFKNLLTHRTSCNDDNLNNGYESVRGYARCNRCWFLEIMEDYENTGEIKHELDFQLSITKLTED